MMQMLGFRGGGASSRRESSSSASAAGSPNADSSASSRHALHRSASVGPARPLRLVYCDEKGKFRMDAEAVAALQLVKGPIGVVSVCGRARQGKSFILNQLLGRGSGFLVASTHRPCTKGLWMWSAPIQRTAIDGTEYSLLLLDSEGIDAYDQTGTYSTQIFSLAVLLSSLFIYNQMGGIDEAALDRLSLVTEMTKHIRVRASGGKSTASEIGQFSPVFAWLLRDFYLDLAEDNRKITPRDYLELALRPVQASGKDMSAKNEIRESIRALFPDRECFTLVRPLNNENELQRLDQIPIEKLRPEFRSGLDALTKFVFERTKPKQVGSTVMTGPILAGLTQSFLDALNNGAVPTISSSWQSVEDAECRRAFESASEVYMSSFDRTKPPDEALLREEHEHSVKKSMEAYNATAVGSGPTRQKYEKLLNNFFKKAFEDYSRNALLEADMQCTNKIQNIEKKLRAACHTPDAKPDKVIQVLDSLISEYSSSSYGPGKWQKLATFLQQCLDGLVLDLFKRQISQLESERTTLRLQCRSSDDKLELLKKQIDANEKHRVEYMKRYEEAIADKRKISEDYSNHLTSLQTKCRSLEEKCGHLSSDLESSRRELSEWKVKYDHNASELRAEEERFTAEVAILKSRVSASEGMLAAAREHAQSAQTETSEWKRKYEVATGEAKAALERAAAAQERTIKKAQERDDALRADFSVKLAEKEDEIKLMKKRMDHAESRGAAVISQLEVSQSKLKDHEHEALSLKGKIKELYEKLEAANVAAQSYEKEARILEQEKNHLEEKYLSEFKKFEEVDLRCKVAEREARRATELADNARAEAAAFQKEKSEIQRLSMERLAQIERVERQVDNLEREKDKLEEDISQLRASEMEAFSKVSLLEERVEDREREIEELLTKNNAERSSTVEVLESLLATERDARAEANKRAERLSLQLQATQGKLDVLHQELASVRLNESALGNKLMSAASRGKRSRVDDYAGVESVQDMEAGEDAVEGRRKRTKSMTSPLQYFMHTEDGGSTFRGEEDRNPSQDGSPESDDHTKFTVLRLKQELTKHGFGAELLQLKNPNKREILNLYEKLVMKK